MAAEQGDLIQVVDNQLYLGQQVLNVYYYRYIPVAPSVSDYLSALNDVFKNVVLTPVRAMQTIYLEHVSREWKNLSNGVDLFVDGTVLAGTRTGDSSEQEPSFVSAGFILRRESLVTRNGYKRIAGLLSEDINGNSWVGGSTITGNIETALASDLNLGIVPALEPIIVKRPIVPPVESYLYASIGSASFRGVGTQNTRKAGRGI